MLLITEPLAITKTKIEFHATEKDPACRRGWRSSPIAARNQLEKSDLHDLLAHTRGKNTKASKTAGRCRADLYQMMRKQDLSAVDYKSE